jgi:phage baseplate assembly protein gpV
MIKYYGDTTRWFIGRVVDIIDPLKLGRIKVRIYGIHTDNVIDISDDDLPWAQVVAPITEGGTNAFGNNLGLLPGAQVFGVFLDGTDSQMPLILGSMPKYEDESVDSISTNPLATGTQTKPYTPDSTIGEPDDPYAAVYPNNLVYETSAGHVKEYDNTTDAERIRELHKSGTFYQIGPDGDLVTHIVRDRYTVIASDDALHVSGNVNVFIDEDATITVGGNTTLNTKNGSVTIDTPQTTMTGNLRVDGGVSVGNDVVTDAGISHNTHTHTDNPGLAGAETTGPH